MQSHTTFNGTSQLRRSKSTPIVQRRSSISSFVDPVAAKQHAIVAATVAYERAHILDCDSEQKYNSARRRAHQAVRSEGQGSHFEASRAPRRQPSKKRAPVTHQANDFTRTRRSATLSSVSAPPVYHSKTESIDVGGYATAGVEESRKHEPTSLNTHGIRKTRSLYTSSRHAPATSIEAISFGAVSSPATIVQSTLQYRDEVMTSIAEQEMNFDDTIETIAPIPPVPLTNSNLYIVDDQVAKARDHHLQQFQMKKIRHRASLMFTPLMRRAGSGGSAEVGPLSGVSSNGVTYGCRRPSPVHAIQPPQQAMASKRKESTSFKDKFKRVFRKPSNMQTGLPVQQVEASRPHFGDLLSASPKVPSIRVKTPINTIRVQQMSSSPYQTVRSVFKEYHRASSPSESEFGTTTSKSRVTSWADSTVAGTTRSRDSSNLAVIPEDPQASVKTPMRSNKQSSFGFFRRTPGQVVEQDLKVKPVSKAQNPTASQRGLGPQRLSAVPRSNSIHDTLPSQVRRSSLEKPRANVFARATVRIISSGSNSVASLGSHNPRVAISSSVAVPAPRSESISLQNASPDQLGGSSRSSWLSKRRRNQTERNQKEPEMVIPSADLIASRVEKSNARWKEPLEHDIPLFYPHTAQRTVEEQNSDVDKFARSQEAVISGLESSEDISMKVGKDRSGRKMDVVSPSLYSRNTNSVSPTRKQVNNSAVSLQSNSSNDTGTAVITTSHPIGKYPIGSAKDGGSQLTRTSKDWRAWISEEIRDLETPPPEGLVLSGDYMVKVVDSQHRREHAQIIDGEQVTIGCIADRDYQRIKPEVRPPVKPSTRYDVDDRPSSRLHQRPALRNRSASCMNERFPLIDTGRPPSRMSRKSKSPPTEAVSSKYVASIKTDDKENKETGRNTSTTSSHLILPVVTSQPSRAALRRPPSTSSFQRSKSSLAHYTTSDNDTSHVNVSTSRTPSHISRVAGITPSLGRPKSAFDVRGIARHHQRITTTPATSMDADPTLADILKGPYRTSNTSLRRLTLRESTPTNKENSPFPIPKTENSPAVRTICEDDTWERMDSSPVRMSIEDATYTLNFPSTPTSGQRLVEQFLNARRLREDSRLSESPSMNVLTGSPLFL